MLENHTEEKTSKSWRLSRSSARSGSSLKYWMTPFGLELRCGTKEPGTAARASSNSSSSAVRILVS